MTPDLKTPDGTPISNFAFGTMQWGGKADAAQSRAMYDAARAAGINFFDTAHGYTDGHSETLLGQFAAPEREALYIATKCASTGNCHPDAITRDFHESLTRLNMDYVDMMYMHRWDDSVPLEATYEALAKMVESGRVRQIGVSNYSAWQVMKAQAVAAKFAMKIVMIQPMYSLVKRQAEVEILPLAEDQDLGVISYSPVGGGLLSGKYAAGSNAEGRLRSNKMYTRRYRLDWMHQVAADFSALAKDEGTHPVTLAVGWAAGHPAITAPIIGARSVEQLRPSLAALSDPMDPSLRDRITALSQAPAPANDRYEEVAG